MTHRFAENPAVLGPAPLLRRLMAMLYDFLLAMAIALLVTGLYMGVWAAVVGAETYKIMNDTGQTRRDPILSSLIFVCLYGFFAYFWTRNGQTLGMQAWRIRIQNPDGTSISYMQALMRFMMGLISWGLAGLGYLWMLVDRKALTWTDRFSESRVVRLDVKK